MSLLLASSYAYHPAALPYVLAGVLAMGIGGGLLLYERFTPASRAFFAMAIVLAGWLLAYGASFLAVEPGVADFWYHVGLAGTALQLPILYGLALRLTGRSRPRLLAASWLGGMVMAGVALGPMSPHAADFVVGSVLAAQGALPALYVGYLSVMLLLVIHEFWQGYRSARSRGEARRHLLMLVAMAMAALALVDFFVPAQVALPSGVAPLAVIATLAVMGLAGTRYRTFSVSAKFTTDEVLRAMGDAVLVCDADGRIRVANAEAQRLLGTAEVGLIGSHLREWLGEAEGAAGCQGEGCPLRPGAPVDTCELFHDRQLFLLPKSGPPIEVSVSMEAVTAGGERRGLVIVARDIRERLVAERALKGAERRYMALFWHNPSPAFEVDLEGRVVAVNPATELLLGRSSQELRGVPFSDLIAPADLDTATKVFAALLRGEPAQYELAVHAADGAEIELRASAIPIHEDGEVVGVFGVALDISEAMRAKREMEVQRRYFADLFESSPDAIVLVSAEADVVLRVNAEFTRMFGYPAREAVGRDLNDLITPEDAREEGLQLNAAAREDGRVREETIRRRKDGSLVEVSVMARKLVVPGEPEQLYGIYRDIGYRMETERRLREREEELRHAQKLEAVGKLAGGVAHDFNNLLTVMNGHARLALEGLAPGHPLEGDLLEIEKAGARAASLTQQLLAYSRRQVLHPQLLDANAVLLEINGMLKRLIGEHIRVETRLTREDAHVQADRGQLEQVLMNLVVNARDAMPEGGTIELATDILELDPDDDRIELWQVMPGSFVRITVKDIGVGMDPETLARAFEPFFTTKEQGKGTGLGLATVFGIVKQSEGHVVLTSRRGEGTRCEVILPLTDASAVVDTTPDTDSVTARPRGSVLVVEDEEAVRQLVVRVLEREGCTVLSAPDGAAAERILEEHDGAFDLVLTDLVMPHMGGRELANRLQHIHPELPVLFMSGYDEERVADSGPGSDFLSKPFTPAALAERVAEVMSAARPQNA